MSSRMVETAFRVGLMPRRIMLQMIIGMVL